MSDFDVTNKTKSARRKQQGRHGLVRLEGMDLRSCAGRAFKKHYALTVQEYGQAHEAQARQLAAVRVALEKLEVEALTDPVAASRAYVPLARHAMKLEAALKATKAPAEPAGAAPSIEEIAARHREGAQ